MAMLVVAIALDVAYWSIWFTQRDWLASEHTQAYYDFENAFPLADLWLGIACVLALVDPGTTSPERPALAVRDRGGRALPRLHGPPLRPRARDLRKGGGGAFEAVIVALTWIFSITVLRFAWTRRAELLAGEG